MQPPGTGDEGENCLAACLATVSSTRLLSLTADEAAETAPGLDPVGQFSQRNLLGWPQVGGYWGFSDSQTSFKILPLTLPPPSGFVRRAATHEIFQFSSSHWQYGETYMGTSHYPGLPFQQTL